MSPQLLANSSGMKNVRSSQEEVELELRKSNVGIKNLFKLFSQEFLVSAMWVMSCCIMNFAATQVGALPFPAPDLQNCRSSESCCTPALSDRTTKKFQFQFDLPLRVRRAAHRVDNAYIAKYQRATERMRALPDTDGRSFLNQYKLHCMYCDNNLYFDDAGGQTTYPLEIHQGWFFYPWHRLYLYFHERILAKLIDDDEFALPFWNWDNQSPAAALQGDAVPNVVPRVYAEEKSLARGAINETSSLYDPDRGACAKLADGFAEFQSVVACPPLDRNATEARAANAWVMYMNMVGGAVTPLLFHGYAYRYGDAGGGGYGALEGTPHGSVHGWVNLHDMQAFKDSASDPIFFAHHANMDRLWELWKSLPGGVRGDIADPDYRQTEFTFYDEDGEIVTVSVAQALQLDQLRYTYEDVPNPWLRNGAVDENSEPERKICNLQNSAAEIETLIETTEPFTGPVNFTQGPLTFKVRRRYPNNLTSSDEHCGEEMLELRGDTKLRVGETVAVTAFAFHPAAPVDESLGCAECLGVRWMISHVGISENAPPEQVWRMGIRHQLQLMGTDHLEDLVVTLTGSVASTAGILFTSAQVIYSNE